MNWRVGYIFIFLLFTLVSIEPAVHGLDTVSFQDVLAFSWSPDSRFLATSYYDDVVQIHDLEAGTYVPLQSSPVGAHLLAWSPDGHYLATASPGRLPGELKVIDVERDQQIFSNGNVNMRRVFYSSVSWSPDSTYLAVAYEYGTGSSAPAVFSVWDVTTGSMLSSNEEIPAWTVDWNPKTSTNAVTHHPYLDAVYLVNPDTAEVEETIKINRVYDAMWNKDGTYLALFRIPYELANFLRYEIQIWDTTAQEVVASYGLDFPDYGIIDFEWHPIHDQISMVIRRWEGGHSKDELILWDWSLDGKIQVLADDLTLLWNIAWKPDGSQIAYTDENRELVIITVD